MKSYDKAILVGYELYIEFVKDISFTEFETMVLNSEGRLFNKKEVGKGEKKND